jgi:hypothetical protein
MKSSSYYVIQGWMINELQLKGNELLVFAIIYGFSKDGQGKFDGSIKYLSDATGASRTTTIKTLHSLIEKELILKENFVVNNIQFCKYFQNELVVLNSYWGSTILEQVGSTKTAPNNIITNNIEDKKQILFSDSIWNSYDYLKIELSKDEKFKKDYYGVDLKFYIEDVLLWSDSQNKKRNNRGWLATLRNWMKRAKNDNKLVLLKNFEGKKGGFTNH